MTNKKFNIIALIIGVVLLVILINVVYIYNRNEASKVYFNLGDVNNNSWVSDDIVFKLDHGKLTFIMNDEALVNKESINFNNRTGEIRAGSKEIYLRSVSDYSIIIWYEKREYNLEKEIIAK